MTEAIEAKFKAIDWEALDVGAVCALYDQTGRPMQERALLLRNCGLPGNGSASPISRPCKPVAVQLALGK